MMGDLSKNFGIDEFTVSADHPNLASEVVISQTDYLKIFYMVRFYLQPLRNQFRKPIQILSGKRSTILNTAIGGSKRSQHRFRKFDGAIDFKYRYRENSMLLMRSFELIAGGFFHAFGQAIIYEGPKKNQYKFIHLSLSNERLHDEMFVKNLSGSYAPYDRFNHSLGSTNWAKE